MATLAEAIEKNRRRQYRFNKAERLLRAVRIRIFDYEDAGKLEKAERIIEKCKTILKPLWEARSHANMEPKMLNYMM